MKMEQHKEISQKTIYQRVGGYQAIEKVVAQFYQYCLMDRSLNHYFIEYVTDIPRIHRTVAEKLSEICDGPRLYTGPNMKKLHAHMPITQKQFDSTWDHFQKAFRHFNVQDDIIDELRKRLYAYQELIVKTKD